MSFYFAGPLEGFDFPVVPGVHFLERIFVLPLPRFEGWVEFAVSTVFLGAGQLGATGAETSVHISGDFAGEAFTFLGH
jgi:hypothetical protein